MRLSFDRAQKKLNVPADAGWFGRSERAEKQFRSSLIPFQTLTYRLLGSSL